ncbi:MAG: succinylglutamate desuccinylase, partial [Chloroflexi bacterium]|nr:succinylglutamate desuccinylase [Chloroflexota bacterium]
MAKPMTIGNVTVMPGEAKRGGIPLGVDLYGRRREMPIIVYRGVEDGPRLWINGATHGDEPEGPYSIMLLLKQLDPKKMKGTLVAVPALNIEAFTAGNRGDPRDTFSYDLNRIYPGKPDGYATERVGWAHWTAMKDNCDLQIAVHSGGEHSYLESAIFAAETPASLELAGAMGPEWNLVNTSGVGRGSPTGMIAEQGGGGITVEWGGWSKMLKTDFHFIGQRFAAAYLNVMRHYGMIEGKAEYAKQWYRGHQVALLA